jgi:trehalose synthase
VKEDAARLCRLIRPGDLAFLHDPQTLGLIGPLRKAGARVLWRSHVGADRPNEVVRRAWEFLLPYAARADACAFSRAEYIWDGLDRRKVWVIPPSIDPFSPKNQDLGPAAVHAILAVAGIAPSGREGPATFLRTDGTPGRVDRAAEMIQDSPVPDDVPLITQVSRWDRLKDPFGLIEAFRRQVAAGTAGHLLLAGPDISRIVDDPEGAEVLKEVIARRESLPPQARAMVHLAVLPLEDIEENAATINAIQRRSDLVVQNSIAEGFGLTVAEAMWKERPVVATQVGGIQDQIVDGQNGLLVEPRDPDALGAAIERMLSDPELARELGRSARRRVTEEFLVTGRLIAYFHIFESLLEGKPMLAGERG